MLRKLLRLLLSWTLLAEAEDLGLLRSGQSAHPADRDIRHGRGMPPGFTRLLLAWLLLVFLGVLQFAASYLPLGRSWRPLVMIPGVLMVVTVAVVFMEVGKGPTIVRGFAVAAMFWLIVLLGLGSADPLTRTDYHVPHAQVD